MIAALVNAGIILDEPAWIAMARRAFDFIAASMTQGDADLAIPGATARRCFRGWPPTTPP